MNLMRVAATIGGTLLFGGWCIGLVVQFDSDMRTGDTDVSAQQILLAIVLSTGAGVVARLIERLPRRLLTGALAGICMVAAVIAGKLLLERAIASHLVQGPSGETPFSLLIEAPVWIGVPAILGAGSGMLGWLVTDLVVRGLAAPVGAPGSTSAPGVLIVAIVAGVVAFTGLLVFHSDAKYLYDGLTSRALPLVIEEQRPLTLRGEVVINTPRNVRIMAERMKAAGVLLAGSTPWASNKACTSGLARAFFTSTARRWTTAGSAKIGA